MTTYHDQIGGVKLHLLHVVFWIAHSRLVLSLSTSLVLSPVLCMAQFAKGESYCTPLIDRLEELEKANSVEDLAFHESDEIALHFYWRRMIEPLREQAIKNSDTHEVVALGPELAARFTGFVEGRLKANLPPRFVSRLHTCGIYQENEVGGGRIYLNPQFAVDLVSPFPEVFTLAPYRLMENMSLVNDDTNETFELPGEIRSEIRTLAEGGDFCISIFPETENYFVAVGIDQMETAFHLFCVDRQNGKCKWKTKVFSGNLLVRGSTGNWGDQWPHQIELVIEKDQLFVFGISPFSFYIEGFRLETGANEFRFSTSY